MIPVVDHSFKAIAQGNKIDHVLIFIQRPINFGFNSIIVTVESLTNISIERNEMRRAEDEIVFGQFDSIRFAHSFIQTVA